MFSSTSSTAALTLPLRGIMTSQKPNSTLVVIDAAVADCQQLMAGVVADAAVLLLESAQDGVAQITSALHQLSSVTQLHVISHGSPGTLYLGNGELSLSNLSDYSETLASWFTGAEAELLLYGCNVAVGDAGEEFIAKLAGLTQAKVAASTTAVGSSSLGGNWSLDVTTDSFVPQLAVSLEMQSSYAGIFDWFQAEKLLADAELNNVAGNVDPSSISQGDIDKDDRFGSSVAIFDGYAFVGVPDNADVVDPDTGLITPGLDVGSVYVFKIDPNDGSWSRDAELTSDEPIFNELFGQSLDASKIPGSDDVYLAVGAPGARTPSPTNGLPDEQTGAVYIFKRDANAWSLVQRVDHTDNGPVNGSFSSKAFDQFGTSVGIDGTTLVVGAPNDARSATAQQTGAIYLFETGDAGASWAQVGDKITNPNAAAEAAGDSFGTSVAIADGLIIAGSPNAEVPNAQSATGTATAGAAYIYRQQPNGTWDVNNAQAIIASDTKSTTGEQQGNFGDQFGSSVDIVNGYAIVGAPGNDIDEGGGTIPFINAGSAYVFQDQAGNWVQTQQLTGNDGKLRAGDQFGVSVGIDDGAIVVGALREEVDGYDDPTFVNEISPDETNPNQIPAPRLPSPGVAYIYELSDDGTAWEQEDRVTGSDRIDGDQFGAAVDVYTSDAGGSTAVVGASTKNFVRGNNDFAVGGVSEFGLNADLTQAGAAYIYRSQPQVQSVTPNVFYINDPLIAGTNPATAENYFTLTVVYDQPMNTGIAPSITFPNPFEDPGSTTGATPDFFVWTDSNTFVARYDLADINVEQVNIDVAVDGGVGLSGAPQVAAVPPNAVVTDIFSIDTKNPTATVFGGYFDGLGLAQPVPSAVNKPFTFVASFDEAIASPSFDYLNANIADFAFDGGGTGIFTVVPISEGTVSVGLAADSALDLRSNLSNRPPVFNTIYDITPPEVTLEVVGYDPAVPINQPFTMRAVFSEVVENFDVGDITIANAVVDASSFQSVSASEYLFNVDPRVNGEIDIPVNISIDAGVANDIATNLNNASNAFSITYDGTRPQVTLTTAAANTVEGPFQVTVNFSEIVSGFDVADIVVTNGNITSVFSTSGSPVSSEFLVDITPIVAGPVSIAVIENGAGDGAGNLNAPSNTLAFDYVPPVPVVTQIVPSVPTLSDNSVGTTFSLSVSYSSVMNPAINPIITFPNPTEDATGTITQTTGSWLNSTTFVQNYSVTDSNFDIADIDVASANAEDVDGNIQEAANSVVSNVFSIEMLSPTVSLTADSATGVVTAIFSEPVSGFDLNDIMVNFGTPSNVQQVSATTYSFDVVADLSMNPIEVTVVDGAAIDPSGNPSELSDTLIIDNINDAPVITPPTTSQSVDGDKVLRFSAANSNTIQIADVDAGSAPIEVTLTATQGLATLTNTSGLTFTTGDGFADDVLTFQGSLSDVNAALEQLRFKPVNITGNASLTIEVNDLGNTGLGGAKTAVPQTIDIAVTKVAENDFNGDGFSDILLRNAFSGDNLVRFMNGTTVLGDGNLGRPIPDVDWRFERTGDFNGDGKADIILRNYNGSGQNLIWYMDGSTILGEELAGRLVPDPAWEIEGTGDFNNDGQTDIILKNYNSDQNLIWYMNGSQIIQEGLFGRDLGDLTWRIQGTADFNGDGQTDILLRHLNPAGLGQNLVWFMNGPDIIGEALIGREVPDINWEIAGAADFNGDGQSDILLRNYASGENLLWEMNGTSIAQETLILDVPDTNWRATV